MRKFTCLIILLCYVPFIAISQQYPLTFEEKVAMDNALSGPVQPQKVIVPQNISDGFTADTILTEDFEGGTFPPPGWTVTDNIGNAVIWATNGFWGEGNYCGSGIAATCSSDDAGDLDFSTELITPAINGNLYLTMEISYDANYQNFANFDFLNLDISTNGGGSWTTVLSWNDDHGSFFGTPGEFVSIDLTPYTAGAGSFILRWHYFDPTTFDFDWYAQIDNVVISGTPAPVPVSPIALLIFGVLAAVFVAARRFKA